jgi:uncharacterized SAM-binding protein YcdF (DUF218 family)
MFFLKKIATGFLLPPGILIILLLAGAFFVRRRMRLFLAGLSVLIYLISIAPTKDLLLMPLENRFKVPGAEEVRSGDAYVLLGGGVNDSAPDMYGNGMLTGDSMIRLMTVYRLYRVERKPIIVSGGAVGTERVPEGQIAKKLLLQMGVRAEDVIVENASKDTYENAQFVAELSSKRGIRRIILVTSAFHMERSVLLFRRHFQEIIPYPAGHYAQAAPYSLLSFIPDAGALACVSIALKEYMGIIFYRMIR